MSFYGNAQATALRLLRRFGRAQQLTLTRVGEGGRGAVDPVAGTVAAPSVPQTGLIDCVVLPLSGGQIRELTGGLTNADEGYAKDLVHGSLRKLIIAAVTAPFAPQAGDTISGLEGVTWTVIGMNPLDPAGTPIIYTVGIGR